MGSFDLSTCVHNEHCKVGCNPGGLEFGLCPDLSHCPDTGCSDPHDKNSECLPIINNCNHELADVSKKKFQVGECG